MKTILALQVILALVFGGAWCVNLYKLVQCDFESPWKGEAIHAVGVFIPPASIVTVWFDAK